ncbi:hypothetical protein GCM10023086_06450 [Streptomyces venetus]|uniref:DUF2690 domain-containing protein n=1 Tax=Streptomyces venetus TaxID=1701086 RepID=A0ABP8F3M4_9ACTN
MPNSKRIAVVAGVLWGVALLGAGAGQAVALDGSGGSNGSGKCVDDGKGNVRCVHQAVYRDGNGTVHVVASQAQSCSSTGCNSSVVIGGKES